MLEELKEEICRANLDLVDESLVRLTWGNVSGIDRDKGIFGIKPSGVSYTDLKPSDIVLVDLEGQKVEGEMNPSSDTKTHLYLFREFEDIGGVTHTHSPYATIFSQAGRELPCMGTTHADHFYGTVPVARFLTQDEVAEDYEHNTGVAIVERFRELGIKPMEMPGVLQHGHAPFTWGKSATDSVKNSVALEMCALMAMHAWQLNPDAGSIPDHILDKHYLRKHGPGAYYGQGKSD